MAFTTPLDLQTIFVDYFAGSMEYFMFIAIILFSYMAARYRMPGTVFLILMGVFTVFMAGYGYGGLLVVSIVVAGLVSYWLLAKTIKT